MIPPIDIPGIQWHDRDQSVHIHSDLPMLSLSSAVVGGGLSQVHDILNLHVHKDYQNPDPAADLIDYAKSIGVSEPFLGLMTAAFLDQAQVVNLTRGEFQLSAVVTAGVSNAVSAGLTPPAQINPPPGTINIILLFACPLTPSALVNAVITASEAKTDVLRHKKILTPQGLPATGTSTDSVVAACRMNGNSYPYAGPLTLPGWLAARAVRDALSRRFNEE